jgi:hypothetical protein
MFVLPVLPDSFIRVKTLAAVRISTPGTPRRATLLAMVSAVLNVALLHVTRVPMASSIVYTPGRVIHTAPPPAVLAAVSAACRATLSLMLSSGIAPKLAASTL